MSVGPLIFELIVVFCIAVILLHHYGRTSKQHPIVTVATLIAWYFSLLIVFILPLDVSSTFYRQCILQETTISIQNISNASTQTADLSSVSNQVLQVVGFPVHTTTAGYLQNFTLNGSVLSTALVTVSNNDTYFQTSPQTSVLPSVPDITTPSHKETCQKPWSFVPKNTLPVMWHIVYWTSQILTWFVLPFMQSYSCAGDFSAWGKIKRAVIENAIYYGTYLFIFVILIIYVAANGMALDVAQLKVILITAANTWGLFLLVLLLGYGLVEVPRSVWNAADVHRSLAQTYFKLAKLSTEKQEATETLHDVLEEIKRIASVVQYNHPQRKHVDVIISKCPEHFQSRVSRGMDDYEDYDPARNDVPSDKLLVDVHKRVISAVHTQNRTTVQWNILMKKALHLENILRNSQMITRKWTEDQEYANTERNNACWRLVCTPTLSWYWYCLVQSKVRKALAACLAITSLMVVWSECTFFNENPVLSLFAIFINLAVANYDYFYVELASCMIISYLCVCAYYTVFRIKFFNYYYIAGHHQTDESSLLFVGIMLCRLTAPLCLNFLGMIHLDTVTEAGVQTSYTQIMGHLVVISFISDGFNIYFPILVCVLCAATYFSLGQRCLSVIGFQRFIDAADDMTSDLVDEGRQLVNREKRRVQRELKALQRSEWQNEHGGDTDMSERQWRGRAMRNAESDGTSLSSVRFNKRKSDKVELLDDVAPIGYSSVAEAAVDDEDKVDALWEKSSRWNAPSRDRAHSSMSKHPPKNLFDDV